MIPRKLNSPDHYLKLMQRFFLCVCAEPSSGILEMLSIRLMNETVILIYNLIIKITRWHGTIYQYEKDGSC